MVKVSPTEELKGESKGLFWGRNVGEMGSIIPGSRGRLVSGC